MSDTCMDRHRRTGVLFWTLLCWTLIGLCSAGHRPFRRGERPRHPRHQDRWAQRIQLPSPHDQGTQRIEYPSLNDEGSQRLRYPWIRDRGQKVHLPSVNDSAAGFQIKKCSPGFYRDGIEPFLGRCVPCECNGLADECDEQTGRCLNCRYNTAGDRCERCREGYYGSAAQRTCRVCPCPFRVDTNSFAVGCREVYGDFQCICRAGYTGDKCERCAPGYFGDPLAPGGSCQPCNCNGNDNNCDPNTGVCKNTLEPGDTNTDERCQECDNCAQTLLNDLEKLDDELDRIKTQMDNASASASSQDWLKKLEKAVSDTKILVNKYSSAVNGQKARVGQLEEDTINLTDDINALKNKADEQASDADKAVADVDKTHKRAKDLDSEMRTILKKIQALMDQLKEAGTSGDTVPNENLDKMLEDAQRMVNEMQDRNFTPQKTAAEKERDAAKKLLDYIKTNVSKQSDQNEAAADKIQGLLKTYEDKLKDLDTALKEAKDLVKKASAQNGLNAQALGPLQRRIEDLKKERKTVEDQMAMAKKELQKTEDLARMLSDSKTEYEQLAAQLDGAKTDLTKKVNEISKVAGKEDIVTAAEEHAKNLDKLANELVDTVKGASGRTEVRNAKDAIDAYKNITDAINAAEAAANDAKRAADNALNNVKNQQLTQRAKDLKVTADDLVRDAKDADKDLRDAANKLPDLKKRLTNAADKKKALEKDLLDAQNQLNGIRRDDINNMIDEAKRTAASANSSATDTMNKLNAMKKEIDKIKITPGDSNLNNMLNDVDQSVKNLLKTIPTLDDKISEVENLTSQFSPITNITDNIKKIKELIEQARDAANRVVIPMKFEGDGYVEMRPPKDLDDLKAYTTVSLTLQRPGGRGDGRRRRRQTEDKGDMFVLYLGNRDSSKNYIGMVLEGNVLYGVYKLNGVEYRIRTGTVSLSPSDTAIFDKVDFHRIYQDVKLVLSKDYRSPTHPAPIEGSQQGDVDKNLLDLNPSDVVFYVGGYPANFTPPRSLNFPGYKGCIEFFSFNDKGVSLYNFHKAEKINPTDPCKRRRSEDNTDFFEGTGYGKALIDKTASFLLVKMSIYTRSENGLLFYIGNEDYYFSVSIEKGIVFLRSNLLTAPGTDNLKKFPMSAQTSDAAEIIIYINSQGKVIVRLLESGKTVVVATVQAVYELDKFKEFYIGGIPQNLRDRFNITIQPFKGCLSKLTLNNDFKALTEEVGISKGCPKEFMVSRKAEFSLGSSLSADLNGFSLANDITVSIGFKSTENTGLILQDKQQANGMNLVMEDGHVILNFNNKLWKSNKKYNDGQWHYLTVTRRGASTELVIDDEDKGQEQSGSVSIPNTNGLLTLGQDKFKGCISNLYTRRPESLYKAEDFSTFQSYGDVLLDVCPVDSPAQLMVAHNAKKR